MHTIQTKQDYNIFNHMNLVIQKHKETIPGAFYIRLER